MYAFESAMATLSQGATGVAVTGLALACMATALVKSNAGWMIAAALFSLPYTYTSGAWYGVLILARLLPLTQLLAAYLIDREENLLAWAFSVPMFLTLGYSFYDILSRQEAFRVLWR